MRRSNLQLHSRTCVVRTAHRHWPVETSIPDERFSTLPNCAVSGEADSQNHTCFIPEFTNVMQLSGISRIRFSFCGVCQRTLQLSRSFVSCTFLTRNACPGPGWFCCFQFHPSSRILATLTEICQPDMLYATGNQLKSIWATIRSLGAYQSPKSQIFISIIFCLHSGI